jgi:DNA invertase Pin-like site-specific DNA recombinase
MLREAGSGVIRLRRWAAGCAKVFSEKASGARGDRAELRKVICRLSCAWTVWRAPQGPCSMSWRRRGAGFHSLKDSWADTTTPHGRLMLT